MRSLMFSPKRILGIFAVLAAVICVGLFVSPKQPVYAQVGGRAVPDARVPDFTGDWLVFTVGVCGYPDVEAQIPAPQCVAPNADEGKHWTITDQVGRVFAGHRGNAQEDKLTGYIAPDGTVSIHYFSPSLHEREHLLLTGTIGFEKGNYVVHGFAHGFSDLPMPSQPCTSMPGQPPPPPNCKIPPAPGYMQTIEGYLVKQ